MIKCKYCLIVILLSGCLQQTKETEDSLASVKNGIDTVYYQSGYIETIGEYKNGLKIDWHYDYYDSIDNQIRGASLYSINQEGLNEIKKLIIYSKRGIKSYELSYVQKDYILDAPDTVYEGDTLSINLSFENPKYYNIRAYTGNIHPTLGNLRGEVKHFLGEDNKVIVNEYAGKSGEQVIKGHIIDSFIEPADDDRFGAYGIEKGTVTYFEHTYYVIPQSEI